MSKSFFEPLEQRQLLSLVVDLRLPGGAKSTTVSSVGQVVNMEIWATATGANATGADEALQIVDGSLLSTNISGGAARGTLQASLSYPFNASGSSTGAQADLDSDGDLDVGSNDDSVATGFYFARTDTLDASGTVSGNKQSWKIGTATFTVTQLLGTTGQTNLVWRIRDWISGALWREDGDPLLKNGVSGGYSAGSPLVIKSTSGGGGTTGSISGIVFSDSDKDGVLDTGESKLGNRKMFLDANKNGKLDTGEKTTYSNASGVYTFTGLAAGSYRVRRADLPANYFNTVPAAGYYDIALTSGQVVTGKDFGAATGSITTGASISGTVFSDTDKDGVLDATETKLGNRRMFIDANQNGKFDTGEKNVYSNASGIYTFSGLTAGTYRVRRDMPVGYYNTVPASGYYDITVTAGQVVTGKNFGAASGTVVTTGSISGTVFSDSDKDGVLDSTETKLGIRQMYIDANKNGKLDTGEKTTYSNSSGVYTFSGLAAGSYRIRRVMPTGYYNTVPSSGYYDITLLAGQVVTGKNFGAAPTAVPAPY